MFSSPFWIDYPYCLPYAILAIVTVIVFVVVAVYLNEVSNFLGKLQCKLILIFYQQTVTGGYFDQVPLRRIGRGDNDVSEPLLDDSESSLDTQLETTDVNEEPVPLKHMLNLTILIPVISYAYLSSLDSASGAIQPLFLAMPINIGGLGLPPRQIGYILGVYNLFDGAFQIVMFGRLVRRFGVKAVFLTAISAFIIIYGLWPVMNLIARGNAFSHLVWVVLGCQLLTCSVMGLGYGAYFIQNQKSL